MKERDAGPTKQPKYCPEKIHAQLSTADAVRIYREINLMTQAELAKKSGCRQPTISALENGREELGIDRAKRIGKALHIHPSLLLFPGMRGQLEWA